MVKTYTLNAEVLPNREVHVTLPPDAPIGPADVVVIVVPKEAPPVRTLGDLAASEFIGMWRDRTDIEDSAAFARRLREEAWSRGS